MSFPQFKKVFSPFANKIHTGCAQRIWRKYFAGILKLQNAVSPQPVGFLIKKRGRRR
jgi:hypothetical protein